MHDKEEEVVEGKQIGDSVANKDVQVLNVYTVKMFALQSGNERNFLHPLSSPAKKWRWMYNKSNRRVTVIIIIIIIISLETITEFICIHNMCM